jgi:hypothetical protein
MTRIITLQAADLAELARAARRRIDAHNVRIAELAEIQRRQREQQQAEDLRAYFSLCFGDLAEQLGMTFTYGVFNGYTGPCGVIHVDNHEHLITLQDGTWYIGGGGDTMRKRAVDHSVAPDPASLTMRRDTLIIALAEQLGGA